MEDKITLAETMALLDTKSVFVWDEFTENQKKTVTKDLYILNRWMSAVSGTKPEIAKYFLLMVNEYFNKHWFELSKHPQLLWMMLCMCSPTDDKVYRHSWIGLKKKSVSKIATFLSSVYPELKDDEIEILCKIRTKEQIKQLADDLGMDPSEIKKIFV